MEISEFQNLMKTLFFESDSKRGIHRTSLWLVEEVGELVRELKKTEDQMDLESVKEEMGDVFAWLCSLANLLGISLEEAANNKYPGYCKKCTKSPCECNR